MLWGQQYLQTAIQLTLQEAYQQFAAHAFTTSGIRVVFDITLFRIVQTYLQLLLCLVVSSFQFNLLWYRGTLTSQVFNAFRFN